MIPLTVVVLDVLRSRPPEMTFAGAATAMIPTRTEFLVGTRHRLHPTASTSRRSSQLLLSVSRIDGGYVRAMGQYAVRWAKAAIRTNEYVQLVAEGKDLEQQVSTPRQGEPDRNDHPDDVTHRSVECQLPR